MSRTPSGAIARSDQIVEEDLSPKTFETVKSLDSRCFGFLGIHDGHQNSSSGKKGDHVGESMFLSKKHIRKGLNKLKAEQSKCIGEEEEEVAEAALYCQMGHLHLLLEEYSEALSAYQSYQSLAQRESSYNVNFLYGLALIYFHMNSLTWAKDLFNKVLRLDPSFARASEVYLRLGLIFKKEGNFIQSMENFNKALTIPGDSSFTKLEIQYHIGHLYFLQSNYISAKKSFEGILSSKAVPNIIKARALRQLGWMFHTIPEVASTCSNPHVKAMELLNLSVTANPCCSQAWYFLGRCRAHLNMDQEAFVAYQHAISTEPSEAQADIWCSVGLLYQKLNQPRDSLRCYMCAVYKKQDHVAGWVNLGCLYEAAAQPTDAYLAFKNAAAALQANSKYKGRYTGFVNGRVHNLEQVVATMGPPTLQQTQTLPSLQQAWHFSIPSNVRSNGPVPSTPYLKLSDLQSPSSGVFNFPSYGPAPQPPQQQQQQLQQQFLDPQRNPVPAPPRKPRSNKAKDPIIIRNINDGWNTDQPHRQHRPLSLPPPPGDPRLFPSPNSPSLTPTVMTPMADSPGGSFYPCPSPMGPDLGMRSAGMGPTPNGVPSMDPYYQRPVMDSSGYTAAFQRRQAGFVSNPNTGNPVYSSASFFGSNGHSSMAPVSLPGVDCLSANVASSMLPPPPRNLPSLHPQYCHQVQKSMAHPPIPPPPPMPHGVPAAMDVMEPRAAPPAQSHRHRQHRPENLRIHPHSACAITETDSPGVRPPSAGMLNSPALHPRSAGMLETHSPLPGMQKPLQDQFWQGSSTPTNPHQQQMSFHSPPSLPDLSASSKLIVPPPSVLGSSLPSASELHPKIVSEPILSPTSDAPYQHNIELSANHTVLNTSNIQDVSPGTDTSSPYQPPPSSIGDSSVFDTLTPPLSLRNKVEQQSSSQGLAAGTSGENLGLDEDDLAVEPLGKTASEIERIDQFLKEYGEESVEIATSSSNKTVGASTCVLDNGGVDKCLSSHVEAASASVNGPGSSSSFESVPVSQPPHQSLQAHKPPSLQGEAPSSALSSSSSQLTKRRPPKRRLSSREEPCRDELLVVQSPLNQVLVGPEIAQNAEISVEVSANVYSEPSLKRARLGRNSSPSMSEAVQSLKPQDTEDKKSLKRSLDDDDTLPDSKRNCIEDTIFDIAQSILNTDIPQSDLFDTFFEGPSVVIAAEVEEGQLEPNRQVGAGNPDLELTSGMGDIEILEDMVVEQEVEVGADSSQLEDDGDEPFSPDYVDQTTAPRYCTSDDLCPRSADLRAAQSPSSVGMPTAQEETVNNDRGTSPDSPVPSPDSSNNKTTKKGYKTSPTARDSAGAISQVNCSPPPNLKPSEISSDARLATAITTRGEHTGTEKATFGFHRHDREVLSAGEVSDSGVSSSGTKQSTLCSSGDNSPQELLSPASNMDSKSCPSNPPPTTAKRKAVSKSTSKPSSSSASMADSSFHLSSARLKKNLLDPIPEPFPSLASSAEYMLKEPSLTPPEAPETEDGTDLHPAVDIYEVKSKEDAFSMDMHAFCSDPDRPICMLRNLCSVLDLNIGLFSSPSLTRCCPDHEIEVREQIQQAADENLDVNGRRQVWKCESSRSFTTVQEYAKYQAKVLLRQEDSTMSELSDYPSSDATSGSQKSRQPRHSRKTIKFGTNVDLSDKVKWKIQLQELKKLPKFLRVACPEADFLSHIGHTILGMNSVQLYMKVPGSRTPGHQENNNFCSININIGPGDCEWFAVHNQYWGVFHQLCEKHKLNFLTGSWWPILSELEDLKVPVYRFTQHMGDVVWLNPGTVHWVQANSVCNNIAWNIGPLTAHQFRMSWERYEWNRIQKVRSIVPMVHLAWNLVQKVKITNEVLYKQLRSLLESSFARSGMLLEQLKKVGIPVHWHGKEAEEPAPSCTNCLDEVFNILFVMQHHNKYLVYCHKCATALKKSFKVLQQFDMKDLEDILTSFQLHSPISSPNPSLSL